MLEETLRRESFCFQPLTLGPHHLQSLREEIHHVKHLRKGHQGPQHLTGETQHVQPLRLRPHCQSPVSQRKTSSSPASQRSTLWIFHPGGKIYHLQTLRGEPHCLCPLREATPSLQFPRERLQPLQALRGRLHHLQDFAISSPSEEYFAIFSLSTKDLAMCRISEENQSPGGQECFPASTPFFHILPSPPLPKRPPTLKKVFLTHLLTSFSPQCSAHSSCYLLLLSVSFQGCLWHIQLCTLRIFSQTTLL